MSQHYEAGPELSNATVGSQSVQRQLSVPWLQQALVMVTSNEFSIG